MMMSGDDESAGLLSQQLDEACQLSSALQRGLDMCSNISAVQQNNAKARSTELTASEHPLARQLDELQHLYRQVYRLRNDL